MLTAACAAPVAEGNVVADVRGRVDGRVAEVVQGELLGVREDADLARRVRAGVAGHALDEPAAVGHAVRVRPGALVREAVGALAVLRKSDRAESSCGPTPGLL